MVDERIINYAEIKIQYNDMGFEAAHFKSYVPFKNHMLELDKNEHEIWKSIQRGSIKQPILRAQRNNVKVIVGTDEADIKKFYRLYTNITKHHIIPKRPYSYFLNIWKTFTKINVVQVLIAEKERNAVAACLVFLFKDRMYLEFLGIDYDSLDSGAAQLIVWEAIQFAHQSGLKYFDFGVTASDNAGLAHYKRKWGCWERDVKYFYYPDAVGYKRFVKRDTKKGKYMIFPNDLKKRIGKVIGTVFFKHFG
jgi:lipid II:glycine glycyltransferase (peptidoglycan interpeptide bridge formation enzyme)